MTWDEILERRVVLVSGKGGTGKSSVAAALAMHAAGRGRAALLVELEGRGEIARTLAIRDPGAHERRTSLGFSVLSITTEPVLAEYLETSAGIQRLGRSLLRSAAVDQLVTATPGLRDLLLAGKLYEIVEQRRTDPRRASLPRYDVVVVDAPPTGQLVAFLGAPGTVSGVAGRGRIARQSRQIDRLLRTETGVVLVAVPEEMAVAETREAALALAQAGFDPPTIVANRVLPPAFPRGTAAAAARLTPGRLEELAGERGVAVGELDAERLLAGAAAAAGRNRAQRAHLAELRSLGARRELPEVPGASGRRLVTALAGTIDGLDVGPPDPIPITPGPKPGGRPTGTLGPALQGAEVVVVCGSGGVGKTTVSAAVALAMARVGGEVALMTVDPARRLASALGLDDLSSGRAMLPIGHARTLEVLQLDTKGTFDQLVERYAGSEESRDRILANRFYRRIADSLAGTHEYMAVEKLFELATEERHDTIVIDTPPTRSALSLLDAPRRLTELLGSRTLRLLLWPSVRATRLGLGAARLGAATFSRTAGRIVGGEVLADVAEFLGAFEGMYGGFRERAERVAELLRAPTTAFLVVAAPSPASLAEASLFVERLSGAGMRARAVAVNRLHDGPTDLPTATAAVADALLAEAEPERRAAGAVLAEAVRGAPRVAAEADAVRGFLARWPRIPVAAVGELAGDVHDVAGLRAVADQLFSGKG